MHKQPEVGQDVPNQTCAPTQTCRDDQKPQHCQNKCNNCTVENHSDLHYLVANINKSNVNKDDILYSERNLPPHLFHTVSEKSMPTILITKLKNKNATVTEVPEEDIIGNPIGMLQELCMIRKWMPPEYNTEQEEGLPHERLFTISCSVGIHREYGVGKSKKLAKRQAAHKMVQKMLTIPAEDEKVNLDDEDEVMDRISNQKGVKTSRRISLFHRNMKHFSGPKLETLRSLELDDNITIDPFKLVRDVANENKVDITYVNIEEKSNSGKFQCLVQLSTVPVAVCHGSGCTLTEAQKDAAINTLKYIQLLACNNIYDQLKPFKMIYDEILPEGSIKQKPVTTD